ncbi:hypothetical protein Tco_0895888 [Tanacetum coccineum]|uniref:Uncharacterized protein n=1 Tax=Tanacetum coccineum TaxID=301880 RepID=A0ABQ5CJ98_9ASTR
MQKHFTDEMIPNRSKVIKVNQRYKFRRWKQAVGLYQMKKIDKTKLGSHLRLLERDSEVSLKNQFLLVQPLERNVIPDSSNICTNDNHVDQNAAEYVDEHAALANLIANLTLDTEENKTYGSGAATSSRKFSDSTSDQKTELENIQTRPL